MNNIESLKIIEILMGSFITNNIFNHTGFWDREYLENKLDYLLYKNTTPFPNPPNELHQTQYILDNYDTYIEWAKSHNVDINNVCKNRYVWNK